MVVNAKFSRPVCAARGLLCYQFAIFFTFPSLTRTQNKESAAGDDGGDTAAVRAEKLLMRYRPITTQISLLSQCLSENELAGAACDCLSLLVQLYGGEDTNALAPDNLVSTYLP